MGSATLELARYCVPSVCDLELVRAFNFASYGAYLNLRSSPSKQHRHHWKELISLLYSVRSAFALETKRGIVAISSVSSQAPRASDQCTRGTNCQPISCFGLWTLNANDKYSFILSLERFIPSRVFFSLSVFEPGFHLPHISSSCMRNFTTL
jgi:hypothetical protein